MKLNRIFASAAALALVLSTGCSKPEESASLTNENEAETAVTEKEGQSETQENTSAEENQSLLGGWQVNTSYSELLAETDRAVFDKALEGLTGAAYTPIQVIAKQTVSGTNYAFLCLETMVTGVPNANHAILTVYENTEGAVEILNIKALDLTDLPVIAESKDEDLLGGWEVTGSGKPGALTAESEQALSDALAGVSGVTYMPIVLLGSQVVSGMNYKFLCYGTASENNPATNLYVVTVYQDASGKSELSSSELFDLNACVTPEN